MVMSRTRAVIAIALAMMISGEPALGSGGPPPIPDYVTAYAQNPEDIAALSAGNLGIMKGTAPQAILYLDWRLLHHYAVGASAGKSLATPCCGDANDRSFAWASARHQVPGASSDVFYIAADRPGPNYTSIPTCFANAFDTAVATLHDRIGRFGASSPSVRAWLAGQDAVFESCSKAGVVLPPLAANAPDWLRADHAYQAAALALYDGRLDDAARAFAAIGRDPNSPWQPKALYLQARVAQRDAVLHPGAEAVARAQAAIARLADAPAGTFGREEIGRMQQVLEYHEHPRELLARLDHELNLPAPVPDIAVKFRDYMSLPEVGARIPDAADWIRTIEAKDRSSGLAHAQTRWTLTHDVAWLVAGLSLAMPSDPATAGLVHDATAISRDDPAWLTAQYHLSRLMIVHGDADAVRMNVDRILAGAQLTRSDRNIFTAIRAQLATSIDDFARYALRRPYCTATDGTCVDGGSPEGDGLVARQRGDFVGWGGDARAVIDRMPLAARMRLGNNPAFPADLRLDITLTNYVRAVLLQDDAAIDRLAAMLAGLLPQVRGDWQAIVRARKGPDKRFAETFVMAKIPSLRTDLASYARPVGKRDRDFYGYWVDWVIVPEGRPAQVRPFPAEQSYLPDGYWNAVDPVGDDPSSPADLTCLGRCGAGAFPLHMPAFAAASLAAATVERRRFVVVADEARPLGRSMWNEMFAYVEARPRDPRSPEALYRLIRIARWGANPDHLGKRAFALIHARYPASAWAKRSPFYYD